MSRRTGLYRKPQGQLLTPTMFCSAMKFSKNLLGNFLPNLSV